MKKFEKVYYRHIIQTDNGRCIVRGYFYKDAPYVYKQMIFNY